MEGQGLAFYLWMLRMFVSLCYGQIHYSGGQTPRRKVAAQEVTATQPSLLVPSNRDNDNLGRKSVQGFMEVVMLCALVRHQGVSYRRWISSVRPDSVCVTPVDVDFLVKTGSC